MYCRKWLDESRSDMAQGWDCHKQGYRSADFDTKKFVAENLIRRRRKIVIGTSLMSYKILTELPSWSECQAGRLRGVVI